MPRCGGPCRRGNDPADKGTFGIGIILGEPTGISARLYLDDDTAVQAGVGFAFIGDGLHAHADYVFHPLILQTRDSFVLPVYVGPGVRMINYEKGRDNHCSRSASARVAGLLFDFKTVPLDAFVEVAGVIEFGFAEDDGGFGVVQRRGRRPLLLLMAALATVARAPPMA